MTFQVAEDGITTVGTLTEGLETKEYEVFTRYVWTYFNTTPGVDFQRVLIGDKEGMIKVEELAQGEYKLTLDRYHINSDPKTDGYLVKGVTVGNLDYPLSDSQSPHIGQLAVKWDKVLDVPFMGAVAVSRQGYLLSHDSRLELRVLDEAYINQWQYDEHLYLVPLANGNLEVVLVVGGYMVVTTIRETNPGYHYNEALLHSMDTCSELYEYSVDNDLSDPDKLQGAPHYPLRGFMVALGNQINYKRRVLKLSRKDLFGYLKYAKKWMQADIPGLQRKSNHDLQQLVLYWFPVELPGIVDLTYRDIQLILKAYREVKGGVGKLQINCHRMLTMLKELFGPNWESKYHGLVEGAKEYYQTMEQAKAKLGYTFLG